MATRNDLLEGLQALLQNMQINQQELYQRLQAAEARRPAEDRKVNIDMKLVDKVGKFDGKRTSWDDWSSFKAVMSAGCQEALLWASAQEDAIDTLTLEGAHLERWVNFNAQLYSALSLVANAGDASTKIRAAGNSQGLEAWRFFVELCESKTRGRQRQCFQALVKPKHDKNKSLLFNLVVWDADLKAGIVLELAATNVREQIHMNSDRYDTYESVRERTVTYLEAKTGDQDESQAMDVDALTKRFNALEKGKGKDKKGKGKGKGKGKEFGKGKKGDGEGKDGSKNGKAKGQQNETSGKGGRSDKINGYCSIFWGWGHPARACWYGQTNNALTGGATTDESIQQAQKAHSGGTSTSAAQQVGTQNCLTQDIGDKDWMLVSTHAQDMEHKLLSMQSSIKGPGRVRALIDTCSAGSVAPPSIGQHSELIRKDLRSYRSATGDYVSVKGIRTFVMDTGEPIVAHTFEVANKEAAAGALIISAATIVNDGNRIILDDEMGGWIVNKKTNRSIWLHKNNNIYEFEASLCPNSEKPRTPKRGPPPGAGREHDHHRHFRHRSHGYHYLQLGSRPGHQHHGQLGPCGPLRARPRGADRLRAAGAPAPCGRGPRR